MSTHNTFSWRNKKKYQYFLAEKAPYLELRTPYTVGRILQIANLLLIADGIRPNTRPSLLTTSSNIVASSPEHTFIFLKLSEMV